MPSRFAAVTNKEISQLIKQAVPEIHEESDEVWFGSLNGKALSFWHEFIDKTGEKVLFSIKPVKKNFDVFVTAGDCWDCVNGILVTQQIYVLHNQ